MVFIKGIGALVITLALFSVFTLKCPKGDVAMGGMADAAVSTFLVEAIFKYICGDFLGLAFLGEVGSVAGGMGGMAAVALVGLAMGTNPVFAIASAAAISGYGILPGFIAGYILHFLIKYVEKYLPEGLDVIVGALVAAGLGRFIAMTADPLVSGVIASIGDSIMVATESSPLFMGFILGGLMKVVCTAPLSSMALTAMLGLTGLPMGIAAIACFGGSFTNGTVFYRLKLGDKSKIIAVMLEPLTQADIVTKNPIPIYGSCFIGGGLAGIGAAALGIINDAPGTASPIPGLLAPFAFNEPGKVVLALAIAAVGGLIGGFVGSILFKNFVKKPETAA